MAEEPADKQNVVKMGTRNWDTVADLARWLLTHHDEFEFGVICLREKPPHEGVPQTVAYCCPARPLHEAVGVLEMGKQDILDHSREAY